MSLTFPRSSPELQGLPSRAISAFIDAVEQQIESLHSLVILRHGHVIAEGWWAPYGHDLPHMLFSLSKSFTSTAVGLAIAEGRLALDDAVVSFFPEDAPAEVSPHLAALQVRHLLSMATGHAKETMESMSAASDGNWARAFLALPLDYPPGTHFLYNSGATYMLSAILQQLTGEHLLTYLTPRLLAPLGISGATWSNCPRGIATGGWGLKTTTEAIAHFGQLYLQRGVWQGQQLLPASWVEQASTPQISNGSNPQSDWEQGYGYQFWRCRHGAYRGDGAFGQYCVVLPEQDMVLAMTGGLGDMQPPLTLIWDLLLPALEAQPLPEDTAAADALRQRMAGLALPFVQGQAAVPLAAQVTGTRYDFAPNDLGIEAITCTFADDGAQLVIRDRQGVHELDCGYGAWRIGATASLEETQPYAGSGAWTAPDTYVAQLYLYQGPYRITLTLRFEDDRLHYTFGLNVSFGPTSFPPVVGDARG